MRRAQLAAARAALAEDAFAPFPNAIWLRSLYVDQLVSGCLHWPRPRYPDPPVPPGASYPDTPVLVLDGDLDAITPLGDSRRAAALFPNATLVSVRNTGHVTALADYADCASGIARRFLATLSPGDVGCAERTPEVHVVPEFPRLLRGAPGAERAGAADRSTAAGPARRLGGGPDGRRRAGPLVEHVRIQRATACAAAASLPPASTSPTARSG